MGVEAVGGHGIGHILEVLVLPGNGHEGAPLQTREQFMFPLGLVHRVGGIDLLSPELHRCSASACAG